MIMKVLFNSFFLFSLLLISVTQCDRVNPEDLVNIPDPDFLTELIKAGVDQDGDGHISHSEAQAVISIDIGPSSVVDITGIEAFIHLDTLRLTLSPVGSFDISKNEALRFLECTGLELNLLDLSGNGALEYLDCSGGAAMSNRLTQLDISNNPDLEVLHCEENQLTALDLSYNTRLKEVFCGRNLIPTLDVSGNVSLSRLVLNNNRITSINVSNNTSLKKLITCGNQLSSLDVSNNTGLVLLGVDNMATIQEVCVWTTPFPPSGVMVLMGYSPNVYFTTECDQ